jgi:hypothetical protein
MVDVLSIVLYRRCLVAHDKSFVLQIIASNCVHHCLQLPILYGGSWFTCVGQFYLQFARLYSYIANINI